MKNAVIAPIQYLSLRWRSIRHAYRRIFKRPVKRLPYSMLTIIYIGTVVMATLLMVLLIYSYFFIGHHRVVFSLVVGAIFFLYLFVVGALIRRHPTIASWLIIVFYTLIASVILAVWSINVPAGILMQAFTIVLAGALLGVRFIIPVTVGSILLMAFIQFATMLGMLHPDVSSLANSPNFGDVAGYGTIFAVFAIVMWLSRLRLEHALQSTLSAEQALQKEKDSLAVRLEEKTRSLKDAQLEEMRQLYRFSELGQTSTTLLHELANHLAVLSLDMDVINQQHHRSKDVVRARETIAYLDRKIRQVRRQLKENSAPQRFAVYPVLKEVVLHLQHRADSQRVELKVRTFGRTRYTRGDPQKLFQALAILVTNAIDAYDESLTERKVIMTIDRREARLKVTVTDFGSGIPTKQRKDLFKPFTSTKKNGMGIGLFIAKQIIEIHMNGSLRLDPRKDQTTFIISLPEDA